MFSVNRADFTGISDDAKLYVSDVLQKAVITVDEGTDTEGIAAPGKLLQILLMHEFLSVRWLRACFNSCSEILGRHSSRTHLHTHSHECDSRQAILFPNC